MDRSSSAYHHVLSVGGGGVSIHNSKVSWVRVGRLRQLSFFLFTHALSLPLTHLTLTFVLWYCLVLSNTFALDLLSGYVFP